MTMKGPGHEALSRQIPLHQGDKGGVASGNRQVYRSARWRCGAQGKNHLSLHEGQGHRLYHLASAADDQAIKTLQERDFFKRYTEATKAVSGGGVEVLPLEIIAETKHRG
jgi:hypothetical protein